jgi:hypothetical protein
MFIICILQSEEIILPNWDTSEKVGADGKISKKYKATITIKGVVFNSEVTRTYDEEHYQWQQSVYYKGSNTNGEDFLITFGGGKVGDGTRYMVISDSIPAQLRIGNDETDSAKDDIVRKGREYLILSARLDGAFAPVGLIRFTITPQGLLNIYDYKLDEK